TASSYSFPTLRSPNLLDELRPHPVDALRLRRQDVLEFFRKEPVAHRVPSERARLADEKQDQQADQHRGEPEKTDLSVSELRDARSEEHTSELQSLRHL